MVRAMKTRARKQKLGAHGSLKKPKAPGFTTSTKRGTGHSRSAHSREAKPAKDTAIPQRKSPQRKLSSKKPGKKNKAAQAPQFQMVEFREYADGRKYEARFCIASGDVPCEDHVNNPEYAKPDQTFTLDMILDERTVGNERQLLPKWKGFELDPNAWEPALGLKGTTAFQTWERQRKASGKKAQSH